MLGILITLSIVAIFIALFLASFFVRRHREVTSPFPDWLSTNEVFNDPSTNRIVRVWLDPEGKRHYVVEGKRPTT